MTYIEFFDEVALENIHSCFTSLPDRVIYIGHQPAMMLQYIKRYKKVLNQRYKAQFDERRREDPTCDCVVDFDYRKVPKENLQSAVNILAALVEEDDDLMFDITGGSELLLLALGIVQERYRHKHIQIQKFNLETNSVYDCDQDGQVRYCHPPVLSVQEDVQIYGGDIVFADTEQKDGRSKEEFTYRWDLTEDFAADIHRMWEICSNDVRQWNRQISVLKQLVSMDTDKETELVCTVPRQNLMNVLSTYHHVDFIQDSTIVPALLQQGVLTAFEDDGTTVTVIFKNEQVKKCLIKEGQILEMKVFATAKELMDKDGEPVYDDAMTGVVLDWDGVWHGHGVNRFGHWVADVKNEIDVMLMHNMIPVFISCKNGDVDADELYKLDTVADRFGGPYARKMLIATAMGQKRRENEEKVRQDPKRADKMDSVDQKFEELRQRAKEMQIRLIEDVDETFEALLADAWRRIPITTEQKK